MPKGIPADIPNRQQLRHWETVCRFLDAQPFRAVAYPYPHDPPISTRLLKRMARFQLVRHRDDCRWQLSRRWHAILTRLWNGLPDEENTPAQVEADVMTQPFIAGRGVDTLYANLLSPDGLPSRLIAACDALKAKAQDEDMTVETPWSARTPFWLKPGHASAGHRRLSPLISHM